MSGYQASASQGKQTQQPLSLPARPIPGTDLITIVWAYVRHELLGVCWALMDVALIAPMALILMPSIRFWPLPAFVAWLLLILLIPFNLTRIMSLADTDMRRQRQALLVFFLLIFFLALRTLVYEPQSVFDASWIASFLDRLARVAPSLWRSDLVLFLLIALLWQRGLSITDRHVSVDDVGFRMRLGGLLFVPLLAGLSLIPGAPTGLFFVMLFFLAALTATALSRAEEVTRRETDASYPMSPRWALTVFLTSLFIVGLSALLGLATSGQGLRQLQQWLAPVWNALLVGGMVVVTTATYLLLYLLTPLQWLLRLFINLLGGLGVQGLPDPDELTPQLTDPDIDQLLLPINDSQGALLLWLNRLGLLILVLVVLLVLYIAYRRYSRERTINLEMEAVGQRQAAMGPASDGLARRIVDRLRRLRRWRTAATIRQCYRAMCDEAARLGYPRAVSQTPFEYLPVLSEAWPEAMDDVHLITDAYVRVRYGEIPEDVEDVERIRKALQRIQKPAQE